MNRSSAWSEFESGEGLGLRALRILLIVAGIFFLGFTGILELTWPQQIILGLLTTFIAIWMDRSSSSYLVTLTLMFVSMYSTFRYGYWRISTTVKFFLDPGSAVDPSSTPSLSRCLSSPRLTPSSSFFSATSRPSGRSAAPPSRSPMTPTPGPRSTSSSPPTTSPSPSSATPRSLP